MHVGMGEPYRIGQELQRQFWHLVVGNTVQIAERIGIYPAHPKHASNGGTAQRFEINCPAASLKESLHCPYDDEPCLPALTVLAVPPAQTHQTNAGTAVLTMKRSQIFPGSAFNAVAVAHEWFTTHRSPS
jgi:hypothetical protein